MHLVLVAGEVAPFGSVTKAMLMPLLAVWVASAGGSRGLVAALLFSWGGDVCLDIDGLFIPGMALFAAAHVSYITCFVRRGALRRVRPVIPIVYGMAWLAAIVVLWPGLGDMRVPVAAYSLLLFSTAVIAWGIGRRAGAGALLFLLSDGLIGVDLAGLPRLPLQGVVVMATYLAAQYLLASGLISARATSAPGRPGVHPRQ
ncbi:lysoplasmalogenase [Nonomuraea sp. NPDC002799]